MIVNEGQKAVDRAVTLKGIRGLTAREVAELINPNLAKDTTSYEKTFEFNFIPFPEEELVGKVIRFYSKIEPKKVSLYLITNDTYDSYSQGKICLKTALKWIEDDKFKVTLYNEVT